VTDRERISEKGALGLLDCSRRAAEEGKEWRELLFACCGGGRNKEECSRVHVTGERKK